MLLLVDAVGAAMTSMATLSLLATEIIRTGLPTGHLLSMASVAAGFMAFDLLAVQRRLAPAIALRIIACLNLGYCLVVLGLMYQYRSVVTPLGVAYLGVEIAIVAAIAVWEWIVASR